MTGTLRLVGLLLTVLVTAAHADPGATDGKFRFADDADRRDVDDEGPHYLTALGWASVVMAIPAWYYWSTKGEQEVDWTRPSWRDKLTLKAWRFDTNPFHFNAVRHPLTGILDYQIARSNGFGPLGSTLFTYGTGIAWELFVEYPENPAINDVIMNGAGGQAIGEPLYQIGQLWRGGELSAGDRLRTAAVSPFAATQDLWRRHQGWHRRRAWSDFAFGAGAVSHRLDDGRFRDELAVGVDIDVVRHPGFLVPGAHGEHVKTGEWSRVAFGARLGGGSSDQGIFATSFRSRTTITGTYSQDADGNAMMFALGTAFTYHRDILAVDWDHLAIAHLFGPQVQLVRRVGATELRLDLAGYGDFGLVDAYVFGPESPLPRPPPLITTLQANGYYDAAGATLESRLRVDRGMWRGDVEVAGHRLWSLDFADRAGDDSSAISRTAAAVAQQIPVAPHGVADLRVYGHAQLGVHGEVFGVAATADAAYRDGTWSNLERATTDWSVGVLATANL